MIWQSTNGFGGQFITKFNVLAGVPPHARKQKIEYD